MLTRSVISLLLAELTNTLVPGRTKMRVVYFQLSLIRKVSQQAPVRWVIWACPHVFLGTVWQNVMLLWWTFVLNLTIDYVQTRYST